VGMAIRILPRCEDKLPKWRLEQAENDDIVTRALKILIEK